MSGVRRAVFFDVENSSRAEHVAHMLDFLNLNPLDGHTELLAVGNWRVVGPATAHLLAGRGARLIHSAPAFGVKDWSDLRIAVAAGLWLGDARAGDQLDIVTDDQAFDAVGDVAAGCGVRFQRVSYRTVAPPESRSRRPKRPRSPRRRRR